MHKRINAKKIVTPDQDNEIVVPCRLEGDLVWYAPVLGGQYYYRGVIDAPAWELYGNWVVQIVDLPEAYKNDLQICKRKVKAAEAFKHVISRKLDPNDTREVIRQEDAAKAIRHTSYIGPYKIYDEVWPNKNGEYPAEDLLRAEKRSALSAILYAPEVTGVVLKFARNILGLSADDLAKSLKTDVDSIYMWEEEDAKEAPIHKYESLLDESIAVNSQN